MEADDEISEVLDFQFLTKCRHNECDRKNETFNQLAAAPEMNFKRVGNGLKSRC